MEEHLQLQGIEEHTQLQPAAGGNEQNMHEYQKVRTALRKQSTVKNEETAEKSNAERKDGMKHVLRRSIVCRDLCESCAESSGRQSKSCRKPTAAVGSTVINQQDRQRWVWELDMLNKHFLPMTLATLNQELPYFALASRRPSR